MGISGVCLVGSTYNMKVLLCTNVFSKTVNGPAKFANILAYENNEKNLEVRILTEDCKKESGSPQNSKIYPVEFKHSHLPISQFLRMYYYHKRAKEIKKIYDFDILLYNHSVLGLFSGLFGKFATAGMVNDDNYLNSEYVSGFYGWMKFTVFRYLEKLSVKNHQFVITNSDYLTKRLISEYNAKPEKVHCLYKAVSFDLMKFNTSRLFKQPIKVLFIKADFIRGGLDILILALALLDRIRFNLTVIGPSVENFSKIGAFCRTVNNVELDFLGELTQEQVRNHLDRNDLLCIPSKKEALGVANIEALSNGIPVISTWVGGIPEVMDYGRNGYLVEPNNPEQLAQAISQCITCKAERQAKSFHAREFIKKFSKEAMFKNLKQILRNYSQ